MILSGAVQAREFGEHLAGRIDSGESTLAIQTISPYLNDRNPFRLLDMVGKNIATCRTGALIPFLDQVAQTKFQGAWVVIASTLSDHQQMSKAAALAKCRTYIILADIWYAADIFGERIPGPFILDDFDHTLSILEPWRFDKNAWVRRTVGVAVHFWAKHTKGGKDFSEKAQALLEFLDPVFEERNINAAKGFGWGLKTLGRYYPICAHGWLVKNLIIQGRKPRAVVRRKALTYLPAHLKEDLST